MTTGRINQVAIVRPRFTRRLPCRLPRCARRGECSYAICESFVRTQAVPPGSDALKGSTGARGRPSCGSPRCKALPPSLAVDITREGDSRLGRFRRQGAVSPGSAPPDFPLRKPATQDCQVGYRSYTRPTSSSGPQFTSGLRYRTPPKGTVSAGQSLFCLSSPPVREGHETLIRSLVPKCLPRVLSRYSPRPSETAYTLSPCSPVR